MKVNAPTKTPAGPAAPRRPRPAGATSPRRRRALLAAAVVAIAAGGIGTAAYLRPSGPSPPELLLEAKSHLTARRYDAAARAASRVPADSPLFRQACLVAGEAATKLRRFDDALAHYDRLPDDGSKESLIGLIAAAEIRMRQGDLGAAEGNYRRVLGRDPRHRIANERLARLLDLEGRRWESIPYVLTLIRLDAFTLEQLIHFGDTDRMVELQEDQVETFLRRRDPGTLIGVARVAVSYGKSVRAKEMLREVVSKRPDQIEAQARMGHLLLGPESSTELLAWHSALPPEADDHPEIWVVRGLHAQDLKQPQVAARCMWEAVRRDPNHLQANHHLSRLLNELGRPGESRPFLDRSERLRELGALLDKVYQKSATTEELRRVSESLESLGRLWESWAWCRATLANAPDESSVSERLRRIEPLLKEDMPRTVAAGNPASALDLSAYPRPDWNSPAPGRGPADGGGSEGGSDGASGGVIFADRAADAGIQFRYFNDPESSAALGGWRMYQFTGGGAAALDFDADSWPDLHLTQGCRWPASEHAGSHADRLYRNLGTGRFAEVSGTAGVAEGGFSQGVAVGDIDGDGFPDLYVANVGRNALFRNNGDGTFADETEAAGIRGDWWTSSAVIADLNGDGNPDVYDANFLTGDNVYDLVCKGETGKARSCQPTEFPAAPDRVYLSRGDGGFDDVTESSGITVPDGNGLGVVAADFAGTGKLDLFVANDSVPNFYFVNRSDGSGGPLSFEEQAQALGVAVDRDGKPQACMGVACDDADGDGLLDLFVTNFYGESNTLYRQQPGGLFSDDTRPAGLREPSLFMLGFGTQFLDGELDGRPDLVLTNGHVDDFRPEGIPYRMRPQYFRNAGEGRFEEVRSPSLGPYFSGEWLGRGLTTLDWNRDGLEDFVVSHLLDDPVSLVTNETPQVGRHLAVHLRGVHGARDAIGATVVVNAGDRTWTKQLTAGDGYMASNERRIVFGLGDADAVDSLEIRWPGGDVQEFGKFAAGADLLFIEGRRAPLNLPSPEG